MSMIALMLLAMMIAGCESADDSPPAEGFVNELPGRGPLPWTHLRFQDKAADFQFLIVADRTGGHREGVFADAVKRAELLRPEFIMSVGDLIEGYTEDEATLTSEWDEFAGLVDGLESPFFFVGGNHDLTNAVMTKLWHERFGPDYYHFLYHDVLFLCLNSEDGARATMGSDQVEYFRGVLERYPDPRWTLVFVHRPLWEQEESPGWSEFEGLLDGRDYTVFAGHVHRYLKTLRRDQRHIVLATTGGVSSLRGPDHGEFDHLTWVTMTDSGPRLANLLLEGILDENVHTERTLELSEQLATLGGTPLLFDPAGEPVSPISLRLSNAEEVPMRVFMRAEAHPLLPEGWSRRDSVSSGKLAYFRVPVDLAAASAPGPHAPLRVEVTRSLDPADHRELSRSSRLNLNVARLLTIPAPPAGLEIDGDLSDWPRLDRGFSGQGPGGEGGADFAIARDDARLYLAVDIKDDHIVTFDPPARRWEHDYLEVRIDPRPVADRGGYYRQWDNRNAVYFSAFPGHEPGEAGIWRRDDYPEDMVVQQRSHAGGYRMEISIPLDYLRQRGGGESLEGFNLNLTVVDRDRVDGEERLASWQPAWHLEEHLIGGGAFTLD